MSSLLLSPAQRTAIARKKHASRQRSEAKKIAKRMAMIAKIQRIGTWPKSPSAK